MSVTTVKLSALSEYKRGENFCRVHLLEEYTELFKSTEGKVMATYLVASCEDQELKL